MGTMFDKKNYQPVESVQNRFSMTMYTSEVPTGDFRITVADDLAKDLQHHYQRQATNLVNDVVLKQSEQLIKVMEAIRDCCVVEESLDDKGELKIRRKKIYDSTINRALELCDTYKEFNLTGNPDLEAARFSLQNLLSGVNPDALRDSDLMRGRVKDELNDILGKFKV
jgi:hypothetical protein